MKAFRVLRAANPCWLDASFSAARRFRKTFRFIWGEMGAREEGGCKETCTLSAGYDNQRSPSAIVARPGAFIGAAGDRWPLLRFCGASFLLSERMKKTLAEACQRYRG